MTKTIAFPYDCSKGTPKIIAEMFQATYGPPSNHDLTSEDQSEDGGVQRQNGIAGQGRRRLPPGTRCLTLNH